MDRATDAAVLVRSSYRRCDPCASTKAGGTSQACCTRRCSATRLALRLRKTRTAGRLSSCSKHGRVSLSMHEKQAFACFRVARGIALGNQVCCRFVPLLLGIAVNRSRFDSGKQGISFGMQFKLGQIAAPGFFSKIVDQSHPRAPFAYPFDYPRAPEHLQAPRPMSVFLSCEQ